MDKTQTAINIFDKYAEQYQNKFMDTSLYHDSFDLFCSQIKKQHAYILELACGPGNITNYLLKKRPDLKILGTDLSPNMLELAKINNPSAEFKLMDAKAIAQLNKKYDGIMCGFCLPYLSKEEAIQLIANASTILNPNGVIYISTMEDDYSKSGPKAGSQGDIMYMHYHQADYLTEALCINNFKIIDISRKHSEMSGGTKVIDLLIIAHI